jgi:GMP synthase (glutamine-hydrolysing)
MNIYEYTKYPWLVKEKVFIENAVKNRKKILGICLGAQLLADVLGGKVYRNKYKEIGWYRTKLYKDALEKNNYIGLPKEFMAFHWHGDTFSIPSGCSRFAYSEACDNQGFNYNEQAYGLQFHLESTPVSVKKLIMNCGDELIDDKYIQKADFMLSQKGYFPESNKIMRDLLNAIIADR